MTNADNPVVSVCIPTFQHAAYIRQCLDSVLQQQTSFPFEIIIGEDDSTDGTREICLQYAAQHPDKIRLFLRKENEKIVIDGKKTGRYNILQNLLEAKGKYIALLDGDDYWCDDYKLQKQVDFMEARPDHSVCFHPTYLNKNGAEDKGTASFKTWTTERTLSITDLARGEYFILTCSCLYRNGFCTSFPDWFWKVPFIDYALHMWNARFGKVGFLPDVMAFYRIHDEGMWSKKLLDFRLRQKIELIHYMIPAFDGEVQSTLLQQQYGLYQKLLPFLLKNKDRESLQFLIQRSATYPQNFQLNWITNSLLELHDEIKESHGYRLGRFINKARRLAAKW